MAGIRKNFILLKACQLHGKTVGSALREACFSFCAQTRRPEGLAPGAPAPGSEDVEYLVVICPPEKPSCWSGSCPEPLTQIQNIFT